MAHVSALVAQPPLAEAMLAIGMQASAVLFTEITTNVLLARTFPVCHVKALCAPTSFASGPACGPASGLGRGPNIPVSGNESCATLLCRVNNVTLGRRSSSSSPLAAACSNSHEPQLLANLQRPPDDGLPAPRNRLLPTTMPIFGFCCTTTPALHSTCRGGDSTCISNGSASSNITRWSYSSACCTPSSPYSLGTGGSGATAPSPFMGQGPTASVPTRDRDLLRSPSLDARTNFKNQFRTDVRLCGRQTQLLQQTAWPELQSRRRYSYLAMTAALRAEIQAAALKKQTGVSLKHLLDFGTQPLERQMLLSARFLHSELPVRLAHRLMDLNHLPPELSDEPHLRRVKGWYAESFSELRTFPPIKDNMDVVRFTAMLKNAVRRHNNVVPAIAKGVEVYKRELERTGESTEQRENEIQHFLDTFFLSRIAIRFLAGHHISMFDPTRPDHIGLVHTRCSPFEVASDAVSTARSMCFREYGNAPQVTVLGNRDLTMAYVPSHLHHMVFELVKNSLRAVQERYSDSDAEHPAIQVVVADGLEDVTIKVSDQGGGIPRSGLKRIWTYLYTTARSPLPDVDIDSSNMPAVLAGYGCGLPLSRLYARYFGGDLQIISMEGYGTDAYLHLARLGNDEEPLPGAV